MIVNETDIFAFIKPAIDAHTLGISSAAELIRDCGYPVLIAGDEIEQAMNDYRYENKRKIVVDWIRNNKISRLGLSYRLDQDDAVKMVGYLLEELKNNRMLAYQGGQVKSIFFGGLPKTCEIISNEFKGLVKTFFGGESAYETLMSIEIPKERIPKDLIEGSLYDDVRMEFGKCVVDAQEYLNLMPLDRSGYPEYGTSEDSVVKRIEYNRMKTFMPLIRAHVGPYSSSVTREESVKEFISWAKILADTQYLDILSIGTSQLTQSNFGENWGDRPNGGGVPINSAEEYRRIWEAARPMLVRTYSGTKNIPELAEMYEKNLNICWHALSLWWFNKLDERGPYDLYTNLKQHIETLKYIAKTNKPFEPNVPHHFAFRGADDVTYIVSAYLSAKLAKKMGVKTLILQNMLNTPKSTWGIQDLAKSRAMLQLIAELEDSKFSVFLQPRAGLDYFTADLYEAKIQLAAVTALMDDIDPYNEASPPIIHVVSYSEAVHLANPAIINESIQITLQSLKKYREWRKQGKIDDMSKHLDVRVRQDELIDSAKIVISAIEQFIENPYSAEGFYKIFAAGFLPVPYLWGETEEFKHAKAWKTKSIKGRIKIIDHNNKPVSTDRIVEYAKLNIKEAGNHRIQRSPY